MSERAERVAEKLPDLGVDALLISNPVNVRYVAGYTGSNGIALIGSDAVRRFYTDFRYASQSAQQVPETFAREIVNTGDLLEALAQTLAQNESSARRLGIDDDHLTVKDHRYLNGLLAGEGWELVSCGGVVERLRMVKEPSEITRIKAAAELTDDILQWICEQRVVDRTERGLAIDLEHEMRLRGALAPSFPSIVASGAHGALPHAEPRDAPISAGTLLTVDLGVILDGYCSDCTRTFAVGGLDGEQRDVYELVLRAQIAGLQGTRPGISGREVDRVARELIEHAGYGEYFGHGLGHGVGMEIHEAPRLSQTASEQPLEPGNVVTVEPGVYLPDRFGVRIEDLVLITEGGCEPLSHFPKELIVL